MKEESPTPAASHLFQMNEVNLTSLDESTAMLFHHNVAKLFFLCKQAWPDIQTAVAFLCTQVKGSDEDNYKKLAWIMKYLQTTLNLASKLKQITLMMWNGGLMHHMESAQI